MRIAKAQAADPLAPYVRASNWLSTAKGAVFVELLIDQDNAALRLRQVSNQNPEIRVLDSPSDVLKLLADKRMQFLWQPLAEWAGPNLEKMRDQHLMRLRVAAAHGDANLPPSTTAESVVRPKVRAILQLARFLMAIGRSSETESILQQQLGTMKVKTDGSWNAIEWFSVAALIGGTRLSRNDFDGAIAEYALIERTLGNSPYADNATINRAALLAQSGHYAEALAAIDPLWVRWSRERRGEKVRGSERQFAWIRACALMGLGRQAEAEAAFEPVIEANKTYDPHFVVETDDTLKLKGLVCMGQTSAVVQMIADQLENGLSPEALLLLQPAYRPQRDSAFWERVRSDPTLISMSSVRARVLPQEMTPALNGWR